MLEPKQRKHSVIPLMLLMLSFDLGTLHEGRLTIMATYPNGAAGGIAIPSPPHQDSLPPPPPSELSQPPAPPEDNAVPPPPDDVPPPPPDPTINGHVEPSRSAELRKKGWALKASRQPLSVEEILRKKREADEAAAKVSLPAS